ncbi:MAG: PD-(D/E)XK nuclease family protein [Selenomonadaceae bacterium]|nr:PD-(D/E)XK nuclease family protein [Selenomonadaceae bacterium]
MVEIIIGRAGVGKTFECLRQAKKILETEPLKTEIIFLLPAYQTYRAELELAALTGGALNTRMNSFNRFARQILDEIGGGLTPRISEIGRRLLLRKILLRRDKAGDLKFFVRAAKQHGFAEILSEELKELGTYSIDADKLDEAIDKIEDAELKDKLHDLKIFAEDFKAALADKLTDDENLLARAAEFMEQSPSIGSAEIFIDGFIFFDPQQRNFLRKLFTCARNVHITLPMDTNLNSRENLSEVGIFNRAFQTFRMLKKFSEEVGVEFKITRLDKPRRFLSEPLKILEQKLFERQCVMRNAQFQCVTRNAQCVMDLKIVAAVNRRAEVEYVAREILQLVKKNYRLREIGIVARDENYFSLIKPIFEIHAIPFFIDKKRAAGNHPLAELIRSALEVLRGWRKESVFRCLRTGFFDVPQEEIDLLENYVIEFGLKGAATWQKTWDLRRVKSLDYAERPAESAELEYLDRINAIRKQSVAPLINFSERVKASENEVVELATALFKLLEELNVYEKLSEWSQAEELRGNLALSREHLKIWDDVITLLEQVVDALGEDTITRTEFESIIGEGLDALEMSLIPPGLDEVTVAQFDQNSLQNSRAIFVLGFDSENFPRKVSEKNLLNDADRVRLNEAELEISLGGKEQALAEKFLIYRGLTEARELLYLSYPLADSKGEKISASSLLNKIRTIFPNAATETVELDVLQNLGEEIFTAGERRLSEETAHRLYAPSKKIQATVTRFENFNECPFKYFSRYGLNLQERVEYKIQTPDIGSILHAVMSRFGRELKSENRQWSSVGEVELNGRVEKILDNITPRLHNKILLSTKTLEHRRERIKKVAVESLSRLIELDKVSEFNPTIFEAGFHDEKKISDVTIDLNGRIDRIDLSSDGKYFLIVDYKTGKASLNLKKIFHGLSLQLAIYLGAAKNFEEVGGREAGAMLYCLLKISNKSGRDDSAASLEAEKELKMPGLIRLDEEIKNAVDSTEKFVAFKKDNLVDREDFQTIIDYAEKILETTAEKILSGNIEVKPAKFSDDDACKYCLYSALCNFDRATDETLTATELKKEEIISAMKETL